MKLATLRFPLCLALILLLSLPSSLANLKSVPREDATPDELRAMSSSDLQKFLTDGKIPTDPALLTELATKIANDPTPFTAKNSDFLHNLFSRMDPTLARTVVPALRSRPDPDGRLVNRELHSLFTSWDEPGLYRKTVYPREAYIQLAMDIANDPSPWKYDPGFLEPIFKQVKLPQDAALVQTFLNRGADTDQSVIKKYLPDLFKNHIQELIGSGKFYQDLSDSRIGNTKKNPLIGFDALTGTWKTAFATFSLDSLKKFTDANYNVQLADDGHLIIKSPGTTKRATPLDFTGDFKPQEEKPGLFTFESGVFIRDKTLVAIPEKIACSDCKVILDFDGNLKAKGSSFPLNSPGRSIEQSGTLWKGEAVIHDDFIELGADSGFDNTAGARIQVKGRTAYFDSRAAFNNYKPGEESTILSDISPDRTIKELELRSTMGNRIEVAYEKTPIPGGTDTKGFVGPYNRINFAKGQGDAVVREFNTADQMNDYFIAVNKGDRTLISPASEFGYGSYSVEQNGKESVRRGEYLKYGPPDTLVRVHGDTPDKDLYIQKDKTGSYSFKTCPATGCVEATLADAYLKIRKVEGGPGSEQLVLGAAGLATAADPKQRMKDKIQNALQELSKGEPIDDSGRKKRLNTFNIAKQISERIGTENVKQLYAETSAKLERGEKVDSAKIVTLFKDNVLPYMRNRQTDIQEDMVKSDFLDAGATQLFDSLMRQSSTPELKTARDQVFNEIINQIPNAQPSGKEDTDWGVQLNYMAAVKLKEGDAAGFEAIRAKIPYIADRLQIVSARVPEYLDAVITSNLEAMPNRAELQKQIIDTIVAAEPELKQKYPELSAKDPNFALRSYDNYNYGYWAGRWR